MKKKAATCFIMLILSLICIQEVAATEVEVTSEPVWFSVEIDGTNYQIAAFLIDNTPVFKLRELAFLLEPTEVRFSVTWKNQMVHLQSGGTYVPVGGELAPPAAGMKISKAPPIMADGAKQDTTAWLIGQNVYIPLEQLGSLLRYGNALVNLEARTAEINFARVQGTENDGQHVVSIFLDSSTAFCNGEKVILSAAPFLQGDILFYPLQDLARLYGATCFFDGQFIRIDTGFSTLICELGKGAFTLNGTSYSTTQYDSFHPELSYVPVTDEYVPQLVNGTVFVPLDFFGSRFTWGGSLLAFPEDNMAIWGEFQNENGIDGVKLGYYYDLIPQEMRNAVVCDGVVDQVLTYNIVRYRLEGMEIYVMDCLIDEDPEFMDGRICAIRVTGPGYSTPRGLQIGDSMEDVIHLYGSHLGRTHNPDKMEIEFENGLVKSLYFSTRYY